jgi:hypothetical protein
MTARVNPPPEVGTLTVTILDPGGEPLARARVDLRAGPRLTLSDLDDPSGLLAYVFGRGGRWVSVIAGGCQLPASLDTRWEGDGRAWLLQVDGRLDGVTEVPSRGTQPERAPTAAMGPNRRRQAAATLVGSPT